MEFAVRARPLAERNLLGVLTKNAVAAAFDKLAGELETKAHALEQARGEDDRLEGTALSGRHPERPDQARAFEKSIFRFFQPAFWRLKKALQSRYDFTRHAVAPPWTKLLKELAAQHEAQAGYEALCEQARLAWRTDDAQGFRSRVAELRTDRRTAHASVKALLQQVAQSSETGALIESLAGIHARFVELDTTLQSFLAEPGRLDFLELTQVLGKLREQTATLAHRTSSGRLRSPAIRSPFGLAASALPANRNRRHSRTKQRRGEKLRN